jgi:hypothetical protein
MKQQLTLMIYALYTLYGFLATAADGGGGWWTEKGQTRLLYYRRWSATSIPSITCTAACYLEGAHHCIVNLTVTKLSIEASIPQLKGPSGKNRISSNIFSFQTNA